MLVQITLIGCLAQLVNGLPFLQGLDFQILDEIQYCQTIVNIPDFDVSLVQGLRMYASNQATYSYLPNRRILPNKRTQGKMF